MKPLIIAFASGLIFGLGLLLSGMNNPAKVRGFLDILGDWQPALIAVMAGAVGLFAVVYALSHKLERPWFAERFHAPRLDLIDRRLLSGAALFGLGWGLVGLCPGPALVNIASLDGRILGFVVMLLIGNRLAHYLIGPVNKSS
ncbi:MAG: YeeE/YedE family protein [Oceanobacter sp.]